jgi:TATA-box binding protein (TBP) (component of TFIID and TFIIIB)
MIATSSLTPPLTFQQTNSTSEIIQKLKSQINLDDLPDGLKISTTTITCKLKTKLDVTNIGKYMGLSKTGVVTVKYGDKIRSIIPVNLKKNKKKKKKKNAFFNQVTVIIQTRNNNRPNLKLFKNGSIQMTGCKSIENFVEVLNILCTELLKTKAIADPKTMSSVILKPFVDIDKRKNVDVSLLYKFKVHLINSNFNIDFSVNREKLYLLLSESKIDCTYEPCVHACVNIKYNYKNCDSISVFVFETGSIIITGAKTLDHLMKAYVFITKKLFENYNHLRLHNLETFMSFNCVKELLNASYGCN